MAAASNATGAVEFWDNGAAQDMVRGNLRKCDEAACLLRRADAHLTREESHTPPATPFWQEWEVPFDTDPGWPQRDLRDGDNSK